MNLRKRMQEYNCPWLEEFLKGKLRNKELETYNKAKRLIYYFPSVIYNITREDFEMVFKYPNDTYICLNKCDIRYKRYDDLYSEINGRNFEPSDFGETRYIKLKDFFDN